MNGNATNVFISGGNIYDTMYGTTGWQGVGQAKAVIFFILVAVIALIQNKLTTSKEVQD